MTALTRRSTALSGVDLASLSSDGHHEVVPDSSHFIHVYQPATVARAIQAILDR